MKPRSKTDGLLRHLDGMVCLKESLQTGYFPHVYNCPQIKKHIQLHVGLGEITILKITTSVNV